MFYQTESDPFCDVTVVVEVASKEPVDARAFRAGRRLERRKPGLVADDRRRRRRIDVDVAGPRRIVGVATPNRLGVGRALRAETAAPEPAAHRRRLRLGFHFFSKATTLIGSRRFVIARLSLGVVELKRFSFPLNDPQFLCGLLFFKNVNSEYEY